MSRKLEIQGSAQFMLCPCCGTTIVRGASDCHCGGRFVGEPLDQTPITIQRFGPALASVASLMLVVTACLIATKWLAFAVVLVIWSARRAVRLAKNAPDWYGGYKTATATLAVTVVGGAALAGYGIAYIPKALDNYRLRHIAATRAAIYHEAGRLEEYKRIFGSYPQEFKKAIGEALPSDYWGTGIKYESKPGDIAERDPKSTGLPLTHFELRSAGPDGIMGTDDDVIMRDGVFITNAELKQQGAAQQLR
ncbi:MAG TPA: hypothetical protein VKF81_05040 [Blastocatellia bacterium]|nr:hypothetical protein [Blastocatellia bacterium]